MSRSSRRTRYVPQPPRRLKIDHNLFKRYGDAQAFASHPALQNREQWDQASAENPVAAAANRSVALYGFYPLTLVVDMAGKVIAVIAGLETLLAGK